MGYFAFARGISVSRLLSTIALIVMGVAGCASTADDAGGAGAVDSSSPGNEAGPSGLPDAPTTQSDGSGSPGAEAAQDDGRGFATDASLDAATDAPAAPALDASPDSAMDASPPATPYSGLRRSNVVIGNVFLCEPGAIAFVSNDEAGFLMRVGWSGTRPATAPDVSIAKLRFGQNGANVSFDWTRTGNAIAARLSADKPITFALRLIPSWSTFKTTFPAPADAAVGQA